MHKYALGKLNKQILTPVLDQLSEEGVLFRNGYSNNPICGPYSPRPFEDCPDYQKYGNNMDEYMRLYNAMVTQVDHGVGQILDEVKELGLKEDTRIIFTSDHGDMQGSHGLKNKSLPYEKSCGVPFIIKDPQGLKGKISDELISGIDIYPSLVEYAGATVPVCIDGRSFKDYLRKEANTTNPFIMSNQTGWQMIRDKQFKLGVKTENKEPYLLFDMIHDPYEMNNLVDNSEYYPIIKKLLQTLNSVLAKLKKVQG